MIRVFVNGLQFKSHHKFFFKHEIFTKLLKKNS